MTQKDPAKARQILDSPQTETDNRYDIRVERSEKPKGLWYLPPKSRSAATLLYFHGGGYAFHGAMSKRFAAMLAHHSNARLFAPDYRLTPEHPHPAQAEDALAAWHHMTCTIAPEKPVVIGDSAGGHMALTLLQTLKSNCLPQPALCIGLCPWTDVDAGGASLHENDRYDIVQGWMALRFGAWLAPDNHPDRATLSPIAQIYRGLAPIYLQAGGREILHDMICNFAVKQAAHGTNVLLDVWPDMPHDFQLFDTLKQSSIDALQRISSAIHDHVDGTGSFGVGKNTLVAHGTFARR